MCYTLLALNVHLFMNQPVNWIRLLLLHLLQFHSSSNQHINGSNLKTRKTPMKKTFHEYLMKIEWVLNCKRDLLIVSMAFISATKQCFMGQTFSPQVARSLQIRRNTFHSAKFLHC